MLGVLQGARAVEAESTGQVAAEAVARIAAEAEEHTDLVVAEAVGVKFVQKETGVIDEELAHVLIPEREGKAAGPAFVGAVKALVVVTVASAVPEIDGMIIAEKPTGVVVHDIENNSDPIQVTEIDKNLELRGRAGDVRGCQWWKVLRGEQSIDGGQMRVESCCVAFDVGQVGREEVSSVVAHGDAAFHLMDWQRLQHVDAERGEVLDLFDHVEERGGLGVVGRGIVGSNVELVHDHVGVVRCNKGGVVPGIRAGGTDNTTALGEWLIDGHLTSIRIALGAGVGVTDDEEDVGVPIGNTRQETGPVSVDVLQQKVGIGAVAHCATESSIQINSIRAWRPCAKGRTSRAETGAHGRGGADVQLRDGR